MATNLIVNPFLQFQPMIDDDSRFRLIAPKPGEGLLTLEVNKREDPNLFEVFSDLVKTRLDYLDPEVDLNAGERTKLFENGVLVEADAKPEIPLFSCELDSVEPFSGDFVRNELIIHPAFRFEPFDLTKFSYFARERHLSPFKPSIWIRSSITGIETGYWISNEQAAIFAGFTDGSPIPDIADESLIRKLLTAGIALTPESIESSDQHWHRAIETARNDFAANKYTVIRHLFPAEYMRSMREYFRKYVGSGFMSFGDDQVGLRYREHNQVLASYLQGQFLDLMSQVVGEPVKRSYVYAASYKGGAILDPHTDREQCEFSISFQVDFEPEPEGQISPWAIYAEPFSDYRDAIQKRGTTIGWDEIENRDRERKPTPIYLASGDGLIYKGRELIHYRYALPEGHRSTSLFFHYVAEDFAGDLN